MGTQHPGASAKGADGAVCRAAGVGTIHLCLSRNTHLLTETSRMDSWKLTETTHWLKRGLFQFKTATSFSEPMTYILTTKCNVAYTTTLWQHFAG